MHMGHNHHHEIDFEAYSGEVNKILKWILFFNLLVAGIKFFVGFSAMSLGIIGDAIHSTIDGLNNVIGLVAIKLASGPADSKHHYGRAKYEAIGALAVVIFLAIAGFELIEKSIERFLHPNSYPDIDSTTINLLLVTLGINLLVWIYENHQAQKLDSHLLKADAAHTFSDILITISILLGIFLISQGYSWVDPFLGLIIAIIIFKSSFSIFRESVPMLVDEAWLQASDLEDLVLQIPKVLRFSGFRSRRNPREAFIEMTVNFDTDSLTEAHNISHHIEDEIKNKYGEKTQVIIHLEPRT